MDVGREIFWNVGQTARWISYLLMVISIVLIVYGLRRRITMWKIGKPIPFAFSHRTVGTDRILHQERHFPWDHPASPESYPGLDAPFIFWGFLLLAIGTALIALQDDFLRLLFGVTFLHGDFYLIFSFILDLAGLAAIVGIAMALVRRYGTQPDQTGQQK